jgi:WD40 repeat protein
MAGKSPSWEPTVSQYAGLKASCRHIAAREGIGVEKIQFVVGTAIVGKTNQLQIIEYREAQATIQCTQTLSHPDELWWLACHPHDPDLLYAISQKSAVRTTSTALYRIPPPDALAQVLGAAEHQPLELIATFATPGQSARRVFVVPEDDGELIVACATSLNLFNVDRPDTPAASVATGDTPISASSPDPMHNTSRVVAAACGSSVRFWDARTNAFTHEIANAHTPDVLDVAFNPNKPWWVCTGGSDGFLRCWDARRTEQGARPAAEFKASSHWVTRAIPSASHEQLILTTGTDSKVKVFNASAFAFHHEGNLREGKVMNSVRQDDSVYSAAWATTSDPWIFASVSYKGQVNVCQLPSYIVDSILMGDESD